MLMEAVENAEALLATNAGIGASLSLDPGYAAAGAAFQAVITALGSGPGSNRAKLDTVR
jgi:hypothetical protein